MPAVAVLLAAKLSELVLVVLVGLNAAVTPLGSPVAARLTLPVKPFCPVTAIVLLPVLDWRTVRLAVEVASVKLGMTTVSVTVVELLSVPEIPVIVTG